MKYNSIMERDIKNILSISKDDINNIILHIDELERDKEEIEEELGKTQALILNLSQNLYKISYKINACDSYMEECVNNEEMLKNTENFIIKIKERSTLELEKDDLFKKKLVLDKNEELLIEAKKKIEKDLKELQKYKYS